jgi:Fe-S-cluster containining protein
MSRRTKKNVNSEVQLEKKLFGLKKMNSRKLDNLFHESHAKEFKTRDCLVCANCCKTTSPIFRDVDINRISKCLGMKSQKFVEQYLRMDEEQDYVLQSSPCAFLDADNTCSIYEDRPLACREYPHTDRKNMYQILDLTVRNISVCPAVEDIVREITKE